MTLGVTGHQNIPRGIESEIRARVSKILRTLPPPLHVVCSLAAGADQLVAGQALELGGHLDVVVPSKGYERTFRTSDSRTTYETLLARASTRTTLPFPEPTEAAFWAAGQMVVQRSDRLLAIWDGKPARGLGGTADVVGYARARGVPIDIVWPRGASQ